MAQFSAPAMPAYHYGSAPIADAMRAARVTFTVAAESMFVRGAAADHSHTLAWVWAPGAPGRGAFGQTWATHVINLRTGGCGVRFDPPGCELRPWTPRRYSLARAVAIAALWQDPDVDEANVWRLVYAPDDQANTVRAQRRADARERAAFNARVEAAWQAYDGPPELAYSTVRNVLEGARS